MKVFFVLRVLGALHGIFQYLHLVFSTMQAKLMLLMTVLILPTLFVLF